MLHSVQTGHKVLKEPLTNQPKVVVPGVEVIHHGALILALLSTARTEGEASLALQSLRGVDPFLAHNFR